MVDMDKIVQTHLTLADLHRFWQLLDSSIGTSTVKSVRDTDLKEKIEGVLSAFDVPIQVGSLEEQADV